MLNTLSFITRHPLTRGHPISALARYARWQVASRLKSEVEFDWIDGARLVVRNGMTGATGNIYCGLHEFSDMAFLLHLLRPGDLFVDVGANIGSYTILASAIAGADTVAIEPDPETMAALKRNVAANGMGERVVTCEAAVGRRGETGFFTIGLDTTNRVVSAQARNTRQIRIMTLDELLQGQAPTLLKIDVEGHEADVIAGASQTLGHSSLLAIEIESHPGEVVAAIEAAGFRRAWYEPFSRQLSTLTPSTQANALFVRELEEIERRLRSAPLRTVLGRQL